MSIAPRNLALAAVAIALFALSAWLDARRGFEPPTPLFTDFDPARVARVRIARTLPQAPGADAKPVQQLVELERTSEGFGIAQCAGFPAHPGAVEDLLQRVAALRAGELLARNEAGRGAYELGEQAPRLELLDASGRALAALRQGRDARGASVVLPLLGSAHDGEVVSAPGLIALDARPEAWLDARVPLPELESVDRIAFEIAGAARSTPIERERPGGPWSGLDANAASALDLLIGALEGIVVVQVDGPVERPVERADERAGATPPAGLVLRMSGAAPFWLLEIWPAGKSDASQSPRVFECNAWGRVYRARMPEASAALIEQRARALDDAVEAAKSRGGDSSNR